MSPLSHCGTTIFFNLGKNNTVLSYLFIYFFRCGNNAARERANKARFQINIPTAYKPWCLEMYPASNLIYSQGLLHDFIITFCV